LLELGLYLPSSSSEKPSQGQVLVTGEGHLKDNGELRPLEVTVGDTVIFGKYSREVNNGIVDGQGTYTYKGGRKRVGEFRKGKQWNVKSYDKNGKRETKWAFGEQAG
jgi:hypothetical protein